MDEASKSRTTVCIAHRLSTIKRADKIIVISRGEIVEEGTHSELIARGGVYKGLVEAQRISTEQKEGIEKAIAEDGESENDIDELVRVKTKDSADHSAIALQRTKTGRSIASVEGEKPDFMDAGIVRPTRYSNIELVRKVILI